MTRDGHITEYVRIKVKARDIVPNWPRSRTTMAMFSGTRFMMRPFARNTQYYRYARIGNGGNGTIEVLTPSFQYVTEDALERKYHNGQQEMVDDFRASYRVLTEEDKNWLWCSEACPLRDAIKQSFRQYADAAVIPPDVLLAIKSAAKDYPFRNAGGWWLWPEISA
jgi:hypothetical protein